MTFIIISFSSGFDSAVIIVSAASADIYSIVETDTYALSDGSAFAKQNTTIYPVSVVYATHSFPSVVYTTILTEIVY